MSQFKLRNPDVKTISQIVQANTGMDESTLLDPFLLVFPVANMDKAAQKVLEAQRQWRRIYVFGDYDVDGICSSYILTALLNEVFYRGARVRLPYRFSEGYGCSPEAIDEFEDNGLLILIDNGIVAYDAINKAKAKGMSVIVIDHHLPKLDDAGKPVLPDADIIVDPHVFPGEFNEYCAGGLALKFAAEYLFLISRTQGFDFFKNKPTADLYSGFQAVAAIATISDSVSLTFENRKIVREGIEIINKHPETLPRGLRVLIEKLELVGIVDEKAIGFKLGPCLNAPGRLYDEGAKKAFTLLYQDLSFKETIPVVEDILNDNEIRKQFCSDWFEAAKIEIEAGQMQEDYPIVLAIPRIPEGVIGIIAGKVAEAFKTPAIVLSDDGTGDCKGSARTFGDVHIKELLDLHSDLIVKYGGHAGAAGLTVKRENVDKLRKELNQSLGKKPKEIAADVYYDIEISKADVSSVMAEVNRFKPYGEGNPAPVVLIRNLTLIPDGAEHYKLLNAGGLKLNAGNVTGISFDCTDKYLAMGTPSKVDLVGTLSQSFFRGNITNQIEFTDIEASEAATQKTALQMALEKRALERV